MVEHIITSANEGQPGLALKVQQPCSPSYHRTTITSTAPSSASSSSLGSTWSTPIPHSSRPLDVKSGHDKSTGTRAGGVEVHDAPPPFLTRTLYSCLSWFSAVPSASGSREKGCSTADWQRLLQKNPNLNGLGGKPPMADITMEEVRRHNKRDDAWVVLNGKVYNITPYLRFHPGGADILMKVAGRDGTSLFVKYHPWVNLKATMGKCLVGTLAMDPLQAQVAAEIREARRLRERKQQEQQAAGMQQQQAAVASQQGQHVSATQQQQQHVVLAAQQGQQGVAAAQQAAGTPQLLQQQQQEAAAQLGQEASGSQQQQATAAAWQGQQVSSTQQQQQQPAAGAQQQQHILLGGQQQEGAAAAALLGAAPELHRCGLLHDRQHGLQQGPAAAAAQHCNVPRTATVQQQQQHEGNLLEGGSMDVQVHCKRT